MVEIKLSSICIRWSIVSNFLKPNMSTIDEWKWTCELSNMCMDVLGNEKNKYKKVSTKERVWKLKYENRISARRAENIETRPNGNLTWKQDFFKVKSSYHL